MSETTEATPNMGEATAAPITVSATDNTAATPDTTANTGTADESHAQDDDAAGASEEDGRGKPIQKRFGELTKRAKQAEREAQEAREQAAYYRGIAERGGQQPGTPQQATPQQLPPDIAAWVGSEPRPEDFPGGEYDPQYSRALNRYDSRVDRAQMATQQRAAQAQQTKASEAKEWQQKVAKAIDRYPDFEEVALNAAVPVTPAMAKVIAKSENGTDVAYWFGTHPDEAKRIASLPQDLQGYHIRDVEERVRANLAAASRTTAAAPPPTTVRGTTAGTSAFNPAKAGMDDFAAHYRKNVSPKLMR